MNTTALSVAGPIRWKHSLAWLTFLAPLFFLSYGWTNHLAAARGVTSNIVFHWESVIPFLPWTIVPYWSIDLMYGLSFLACRTAREVNHHGLRLLSAQCISVVCFIAFPLRFTAQRPATDGLFGGLFDALTSFDLPYNQAPSLHISLLLVIWWVVLRHSTSGWRWVLHAWALLVAASVLTTWQHHFFDLPTGLLAGLLCLWLWPDHGKPPLTIARTSARPRFALWYLLGAVICLFLAMQGDWLMWAGWPAAALALVAANYAWFGADGFQKHEGKQSLAVRWLFAPYRLGAWINSRLWTRRQPAPSQIVDGIWLGRLPTSTELTQQGFDAIVDVTAEFDTPVAGIDHFSVPMLDLAMPSCAVLDQATDAITLANKAADRVLVCCALGYSRSALTVAAWLLRSGRCSDIITAIECIQTARPQIVISTAQRKLLEQCINER
ncbi:MAG: phosphatase PAP2/dual specificity phosphatase family protein [Candidatus Thiodiazotropha sp.]